MARRARAVIGANFGDEGKGLITDYLCDVEGAGVVIRFNGGAQAGHTVVTPTGQRHVFQHYGAGSFCLVPTYLSEFFIINPLIFLREHEALGKFVLPPQVFASPECIVTTFADMLINQRIEESRGAKRHGSVGVGINETWERSQIRELRITMGDLWNGNTRVKQKLEEICTKYAKFRIGEVIKDPESMIEAYLRACSAMAEMVAPLGIADCADADPVFEGAQGLLLDQGNKVFFPHVTRSNTGMKNVFELCARAGIDNIEPYYVSRTYLTRHGAGPLPGENPGMRFQDSTNVDHPYQGKIRFAPLDTGSLIDRCREDSNGTAYKLVLTHCDQLSPPCNADLYTYGPARVDVEKIKRR